MIRILMCTFNGEKYVREQIDSILQQTEQDFELLISDDGSGDGTMEILREYEAAYPGKIRVSAQVPPAGSAQKHFLMLFQQGFQGDADYICLCDQDDVWDKDKLAETRMHMTALEAVYQKETPLLVHCDSAVADQQLAEIAPSYVRYQKMTPSRCRFCQLLVQNNVVGGAMMINRALAAMLTTVPEHCVMHDEWIALVAAAFGQIRFVDKPLYLYRQHGDNVLGADRGSRVKEVLGRFGIGREDGRSKAEMDAHSQSVYREMFLQAESFRAIYGDRLPEARRRELEEFLSIPEKNRFGKICTILGGGFTYNMLHRTIGECIFMP